MTTSPSTTTSAMPLPDMVVVLPPYSGPDTECVKCSHPGAYTRYRPATARHMAERNGVTALRGPLPERLERECQRCDYAWDEALDPAPGVRQATAGDVAHALALACYSDAVDLHPEVAEHMAGALLEMLHVYVRPGHPVWKPAPARLLVPPAAAPDPAGSALVASVPIVVPADARPVAVAAASTVPVHETPVPAAANTHISGGEA